MSQASQSIEELEVQIRDAVSSERYEAARELLEQHRVQVEAAYQALPAREWPQSDLVHRALDLCNWASTLIRTSRAHQIDQLAQLGGVSPYLTPTAERRPTWQFNA